VKGDEMRHPNIEVETAIIRLNDALCMWERNTFRQSVLIIREQGGKEHCNYCEYCSGLLKTHYNKLLQMMPKNEKEV